MNEHDIAARVLGAHNLARQEQAELGKAEPCDPPMGIETPAQINRIRDAIAADRCDGESEYARGINAACENHLKLIDTMLDYKFSEPEVPAADQTPPADAHGPEFDNGPDCAKTTGECTCGLDGGNPDLCEHYLRAQARRQSEKGNHTNAERLWDAAKEAEDKGKWFISEKVACRREDGCQTPGHCERIEVCAGRRA